MSWVAGRGGGKRRWLSLWRRSGSELRWAAKALQWLWYPHLHPIASLGSLCND